MDSELSEPALLEFHYSATGVRELDRIAIEDRGIPGLTLMKRAAEACVDVLLNEWPEASRVAVVCGSGNNGNS